MKQHNQEECLSVGGGAELGKKNGSQTLFSLSVSLEWLFNDAKSVVYFFPRNKALFVRTNFLKETDCCLITVVAPGNNGGWLLPGLSSTLYLHICSLLLFTFSVTAWWWSTSNLHSSYPLQLEAESLIPAQPATGRPTRLADHSGVQPEHGADFSCRT